jgi:DNA polymerase III delta subunit
MKLVLIHGNLQDSVIKKITQIKKEFDPLSITEISDVGIGFNLSSPSLFSEKRLVILENPDIKAVEKAAEEKDPDLTVLIKFSKTLEKSSAVLKKVIETKGEILTFDEANQTSIFPFLDMLGTKNRNSFKEFEKNYSEYGGQYLLTMLAYFLRRMVQKPKSSSDFMRQKIESQKRNFDLEKIKKLYKEIIETDLRIKQGLIEEKLALTMLVQNILN